MLASPFRALEWDILRWRTLIMIEELVVDNRHGLCSITSSGGPVQGYQGRHTVGGDQLFQTMRRSRQMAPSLLTQLTDDAWLSVL